MWDADADIARRVEGSPNAIGCLGRCQREKLLERVLVAVQQSQDGRVADPVAYQLAQSTEVFADGYPRTAPIADLGSVPDLLQPIVQLRRQAPIVGRLLHR
jgi:hypothetical protein